MAYTGLSLVMMKSCRLARASEINSSNLDTLLDNFSITKRMLIKRDVTSGVHYCSLLEYFAIAVTTYTAGILTTCAYSLC